MKYACAILFLFSLPLLTACQRTPAVPAERPEDFRLVYQWWAGSMPPPYYYEYRLEMEGSGSAWIILTPDYPSPTVPAFTENFSLSPAELDDLYQKLAGQGLFSQRWQAEEYPPVGGSTWLLEATAAERNVRLLSYTVERQQPQAEQIAEAVQAVVPAEVWERLEAKRQEYAGTNQ
jgi:hypothetical protein